MYKVTIKSSYRISCLPISFKYKQWCIFYFFNIIVNIFARVSSKLLLFMGYCVQKFEVKNELNTFWSIYYPLRRGQRSNMTALPILVLIETVKHGERGEDIQQKVRGWTRTRAYCSRSLRHVVARSSCWAKPTPPYTVFYRHYIDNTLYSVIEL